jgi:hypothetical protein
MSSNRAMCLQCTSPVDLDPADILLTAAPPPERSGAYASDGHCRGVGLRRSTAHRQRVDSGPQHA